MDTKKENIEEFDPSDLDEVEEFDQSDLDGVDLVENKKDPIVPTEEEGSFIQEYKTPIVMGATGAAMGAPLLIKTGEKNIDKFNNFADKLYKKSNIVDFINATGSEGAELIKNNLLNPNEIDPAKLGKEAKEAGLRFKTKENQAKYWIDQAEQAKKTLHKALDIPGEISPYEQLNKLKSIRSEMGKAENKFGVGPQTIHSAPEVQSEIDLIDKKIKKYEGLLDSINDPNIPKGAKEKLLKELKDEQVLMSPLHSDINRASIFYKPDTSDVGKSLVKGAYKELTEDQIRKYAEKIGLDPEILLSQYRKQVLRTGETGAAAAISQKTLGKQLSKEFAPAGLQTALDLAHPQVGVTRRLWNKYALPMEALLLEKAGDVTKHIPTSAIKMGKTALKAAPIIGAGATAYSLHEVGASPEEVVVGTALGEVPYLGLGFDLLTPERQLQVIRDVKNDPKNTMSILKEAVKQTPKDYGFDDGGTVPFMTQKQEELNPEEKVFGKTLRDEQLKTTQEDFIKAQTPALKRTSDLGKEFIKSQEGFSSKPKWDYKQHSYGYGSKYEPGMPTEINEEQASQMLADKLSTYEQMANNLIGDKQVPQETYDAIVSYLYNTGTGALRKKSGEESEFSKYAKSGDWNNAINEMDIVTAGGKRLPGLEKRRRMERDLARQGLFSQLRNKVVVK